MPSNNATKNYSQKYTSPYNKTPHLNHNSKPSTKNHTNYLKRNYHCKINTSPNPNHDSPPNDSTHIVPKAKPQIIYSKNPTSTPTMNSPSNYLQIENDFYLFFTDLFSILYLFTIIFLSIFHFTILIALSILPFYSN
jgi:hypothetical protein